MDITLKGLMMGKWDAEDITRSDVVENAKRQRTRTNKGLQKLSAKSMGNSWSLVRPTWTHLDETTSSQTT